MSVSHAGGYAEIRNPVSVLIKRADLPHIYTDDRRIRWPASRCWTFRWQDWKMHTWQLSDVWISYNYTHFGWKPQQSGNPPHYFSVFYPVTEIQLWTQNKQSNVRKCVISVICMAGLCPMTWPFNVLVNNRALTSHSPVNRYQRLLGSIASCSPRRPVLR